MSNVVYILDTCILNILFFYPGPKRESVERELLAVDRNTVYVSAISLHELIVFGLCPQIPQNMNKTGAVKQLQTLSDLIVKLSAFQILPYTEKDQEVFERRIPAAAKRAGPMDCRIAASALSHVNAVLVTEDEEPFRLAGATQVNWASV